MNNIQSPDNSDSGIEREILTKGKTAPRVTMADIAANIVSEHYFTATDGAMGYDLAAQGHSAHGAAFTGSPLDLLTFCVLVLKNGFTVTGESACASPENFDPDIGRRIARENAVGKCWPLLGYTLKEQLYQRTQPAQSPSGDINTGA